MVFRGFLGVPASPMVHSAFLGATVAGGVLLMGGLKPITGICSVVLTMYSLASLIREWGHRFVAYGIDPDGRQADCSIYLQLRSNFFWLGDNRYKEFGRVRSAKSRARFQTLEVPRPVTLPEHVSRLFVEKGIIQFKPGTVAFDSQSKGFYIPVEIR